jgi:hypothetical protein
MTDCSQGGGFILPWMQWGEEGKYYVLWTTEMKPLLCERRPSDYYTPTKQSGNTEKYFIQKDSQQ